jgi:GNAT superfamily N-acetyltransferase
VRIGDAERISELVNELGYPTTIAEMSSRLSMILTDPDYVTYVAEVDSCVVGIAGATLGRYYERNGIYSRLVILAVSSAARGIGSELVAAIESWSITKGAHEMFVNSGLHRNDAHRFYERCGYQRTGYRFVKQLGEPSASVPPPG